jgi:hypothetical protein
MRNPDLARHARVAILLHRLTDSHTFALPTSPQRLSRAAPFGFMRAGFPSLGYNGAS